MSVIHARKQSCIYCQCDVIVQDSLQHVLVLVHYETAWQLVQ